MGDNEKITYEYVVGKVRKTFEHADARQIFEHIAVLFILKLRSVHVPLNHIIIMIMTERLPPARRF